MVTRSRTVIIDAGYIVNSSSSSSGGGEESSFEFTGTGTNSVEILDSDDARIFADLVSIRVYISGTRRPSSWWAASQGAEGTTVTLSGIRVFPSGAECCIDYRPLVA